MKTNRIILTIAILTFSIQAFSQLKYTSTNRLGVNTTTPSYTLDVQGSSRLNGYVGINGPVPTGYPLGIRSYYGQTIMIDPSSYTNKSIIGSTTDVINFWYSTTGHNKVRASSFETVSDSTIKKNIETLPSGALQKVLNIRSVSFEFKEGQEPLNNGNSRKIGLIAQELEEILPEAVSYSEVGKIKMIDYDMLIPVLIKAIQEQQDDIKEIKTLKSEKSTQKSAVKDNSYPTGNNEGKNINDIKQESVNLEESILYQNAPNPFSEQTEIRYVIPNDASNAYLHIFDMQGKLIETLLINDFGNGFIHINGYQYDAGMYLYTLIVNGQEIDTKRMILTN